MNKSYKISSYLAYPVLLKVDMPPVETIMIHPYAVIDLQAKALIEPIPTGLQVYEHPMNREEESNQTPQTDLRLKRNQSRPSTGQPQDPDNSSS